MVRVGVCVIVKLGVLHIYMGLRVIVMVRVGVYVMF